MQTTKSLQNHLLSEEQQSHIPVTVFLMNGYQMRGEVAGFDDAVVVLESEGRQQMIFQHAISTIVPIRAIPLN